HTGTHLYTNSNTKRHRHGCLHTLKHTHTHTDTHTQEECQTWQSATGTERVETAAKLCVWPRCRGTTPQPTHTHTPPQTHTLAYRNTHTHTHTHTDTHTQTPTPFTLCLIKAIHLEFISFW